MRTVYQMARDGRVPSIRVGGRWRFRPADVDSWLASQARGPGTQASARSAPAVMEAGELATFLSGFADPFARRLAFIGRLTAACESRGWLPPVVVGGHAVEFYSAGGYATVDIDLVSASEPLDEILGSWGFDRRGRHWIREDLGLVVEAPGSRLAPRQRDHLTQVHVGGTTVYILGLEDVIVDRLAACVRWSSETDCHWAEVLLTAHSSDVDVAYLRLRGKEMEVEAQLDGILEQTR